MFFLVLILQNDLHAVCFTSPRKDGVEAIPSISTAPPPREMSNYIINNEYIFLRFMYYARRANNLKGIQEG